MVHEGKQDSWRLRYLVDTYLAPARVGLQAAAQEDLGLTDQEFVIWYYLFVGGGSLLWSMGPEAKLLFDVDPGDPELVDLHAKMMVEFLLSRQPE